MEKRKRRKEEQTSSDETETKQITTLGFWCMTTSRCLLNASMSLAMISSPRLALSLCNNDGARTQRLLNRLSLANTISALLLGRLAGSAMDCYGRKPALVTAPLVACLTRAILVTYPSKKMYMLYRFIVALVYLPYFSALNASINDFNVSPKARQLMDSLCTMTRLLFFSVSARISKDTDALKLSAVFSLLASCITAWGTPESLSKEDAKSLTWKNAIRNPLGGITSVFTTSKTVMALGVIALLKSLSTHNSSLAMYRRTRFKWGRKEESNFAFVSNLVSLLGPFTIDPLLWILGAKGVARFAELLGAMVCVVDASSQDPRHPQLAESVRVALSHGDVVFDVALANEARKCKVGQGELAAALGNLITLPGLAAPSFFSELYARTEATIPAASVMVTGAIHLLNATVFIPALWPDSS
eukprot:m.68995 g.68995  ORF g.68995 m.68995 type:complete len:416 (+) comp12020_c0_seq1:82-1329(+)